MKQTQRHDAIIELVKKQGYVSTEELVEHFSVSPQTIRRDLNDLAEQNMILRHHGGARTLSPSSVSISAFSVLAVLIATARCWNLTTMRYAPSARLSKIRAT